MSNNILIIKSKCGKYNFHIDTETGIRVHTERILQDNEYIRNNNSDDAFKEKEEKEKSFIENKKTGFLQQKRDFQHVLGELKQSTLHHLMKLYPLFRYGNEPILVDGKKANTATIIEYVGLKKKSGTEFLKELVDKQILKVIPGRGSSKYYAPSGVFTVKGKFEIHDEWTVKIFQKKLQDIIEKVEKDIENRNRSRKSKLELYPLAILAAVLPYFHFQTFFLCKNYDEDIIGIHQTVTEALKANPKAIKHLPKNMLWGLATGQELKKLGKYQRDKLDIYLKILINAGAIAFWQGKKNLVLINPDLVFVSTTLKDDSWYKVIKTLFQQSDEE
ncbi:hypothetical protein ABEY63_25490 [Priestia aryabhattai]|uniref:hypothetical protein n=1 Tax=Priestia aryabhattai TaxID=412384 RepID=UPI003D282140